MKKILGIVTLALFGFVLSAPAQTVEQAEEKTESGIKKAARKTERAARKAVRKTDRAANKAAKATKKAAKKVGNETAEAASNVKAAVTDQMHKDKVGPDGQTIYIDNHAKYYWIDDKGKRHYVTEAELKAKN